MIRRTVLYEEAVVVAMSRYLDDHPGLTQAMNAIDGLADQASATATATETIRAGAGNRLPP
ncbi:hypothetical protein ABGB12_26890 [Actinocorallia sp. B10E7]|uniref:hypothetical protein n=1 Tax=Actinocorallia sp. B10E7 TaxID=3153558 RepID=UPI00325CDE37